MTAPTDVLVPGAGHEGPISRRVDWAVVPRVNLLPPEILAERRFRRLQTTLAGCLVAVVVLAAAAVGWTELSVSNASGDLDVVRAETVRLQSEQSRYAEVPQRAAELEAARVARERALGTDVLWYRFLTDLAVNTPDGTTLQTVSVSMTGTSGGGDVLAPSGLGTVKATGKAGKFADVAAWLEDVARVNGLAGTTLQSAARADAGTDAGTVTWSGAAVVTTAALSHRYDRKAS